MKIFVLSKFEWWFYTGFAVNMKNPMSLASHIIQINNQTDYSFLMAQPILAVIQLYQMKNGKKKTTQHRRTGSHSAVSNVLATDACLTADLRVKSSIQA